MRPMKRPSDMTAQMAVLGFVVGKPDTRQNILYQFNDRFESAGFAKPAGYNSLKDLLEKGHLRVVGDTFHATPEGQDALFEWMLGPVPAPGIRAPILGKLEFVTVEQLETVVRRLKEEERAYKAACSKVTGRVHEEQRQRLRRAKRVESRGGEETFGERLRAIQGAHEAKLWEGTVESLEDVREELEELLENLRAGKGPVA